MKKYIGLTIAELLDLRLALHYLAQADKSVVKSAVGEDALEIYNRIGRFSALDNKLIAAEVRLEMQEKEAK